MIDIMLLFICALLTIKGFIVSGIIKGLRSDICELQLQIDRLKPPITFNPEYVLEAMRSLSQLGIKKEYAEAFINHNIMKAELELDAMEKHKSDILNIPHQVPDWMKNGEKQPGE